MNQYDEDVEHETNQASGKQRSWPWGWIGCFGLALLFFFGPVIMIAWSNYIHVIGMALSGLLIWLLLAIILRKKMTDTGMILPSILLVGALITFGLLMPVIDFLPCPSWCTRQVVKKSDYRAMACIFSQPLPPSFRITQIHYPGYNLLFNGPDGPLAAEYEAILEKQDYPTLIGNASSEEVPSQNGDWPAFGYQSKALLERFGNDWPTKFDRDHWDDKNPKPPKAYWMKCTVRNTMLSSLVTVDDRSSSTIHLYIYTKIPYWMD